MRVERHSPEYEIVTGFIECDGVEEEHVLGAVSTEPLAREIVAMMKADQHWANYCPSYRRIEAAHVQSQSF